MIGILRLMFFGFVVLTLAYGLLSIYARSVERERLEKTFDKGDVEGTRDAYIEAGMLAYKHSLRQRLIWLVYIIPAVAFGLIVYVVNFQ